MSPGRERPTLVASTRPEGRPHLLFNSHLDTFPPAEGQWTHPPFGGVVENGRIYGCGASDMKAGLSISLFVAKLATEVVVDLEGR